MAVNLDNFGAIGDSFLNDTFLQAAQDITVSQLLLQPDGSGGFVEIWQVLEVVKGFVITKTVSEPIESGRKISYQMSKVHIRPLTGITEDMKLTINGKMYTIEGINDVVSADQWLIIDAKKGVMR